jgi:tetratricopeptide (TPR) repeat protein
MDHLSLTDRFSFNAQDYLLKTTDDAETRQIVLRLFRQGDILHSARVYYNGVLSEDERQELALHYHQRSKDDLFKLFQLHSQCKNSASDASTKYLLAGGFLKYEMAQEAIATLQQVLQSQPDTPLVHAMLGQAHLRMKEYEQAREQFQQAIAVNENYADLHFNLGLCEYYLLHCDPAVRAFSRAIKINPHYGEAYLYLGITLLLNVKLGEEYELTLRLAEQAQKLFQRALAILPSLGGATFDQGLRLVQQEKFEEAFDVLAPVVAGISGNKPEVVNYLFHLLVLHELEKVRPEQAWQEIKRLEKLRQSFPNYPDIEHELGFAYAVLGLTNTTQSLWHFEKALAMNPAYKKAQKGLKLLKNDQRGFRRLLHAMQPV